MTRRHSFIPFCVALPTALALWAYFYTVSLPFRVVFLKHSVGPLLLWQIQSPFSLSSITLFTVFLTVIFFTSLILQRNKRPLVPFVSFWVLGFTPLLLSPLSTKFPEFIPLALVLLPASSVSAFLVLIFWSQRTGSETPSRQILEPRLAPYIVWIITFFIILTSGLYICERPGGGYTRGDIQHYFTIARSMHVDHDIDMANNIEGLGEHQWSGSERYHLSKYSPKGHAYSWHPVGLPLILAPFFDGVHDFQEALVVMCIIAAFLASQMYLAVFEETGNTGISLLVWIVLSFSSPLWVYSYEAWPMLPCGLCLLYAWRRMSNFRENGFCQIVILNLLLAWLLWLHDSFIVCYGILGILLLYHWARKLRDPKTLTTVILQGLNVGIFFWFHYRWFGKHLFGQEAKVLSFWPGMLGTWLDHHWGMIFAGPIHLLCFILILVYAFRKRNLSSFMLLALYAAAFVPATATWYWKHRLWGAHPGRRIVGLIPLTCVVLGYFLKRKKTPAFYWLVGFLSLLSVTYMFYFVLNPRDLDRPIHCLALSHQQFRTVSFHLPAFGKSFSSLPWSHVRVLSLSLVLFALFWVLLLAKEAKGNRSRTFALAIKPGLQAPGCSKKSRDKPVFLFTGMWITLIWIFVSVGWMKTHFDTPSPIPWNTITNCVGKNNISGIAHPPLESSLYRYLVCGLDRTQEKLSWSIEIKKRLPTYLDLAKGMYRFDVTGTGRPLSSATLTILELPEGKELHSSHVSVDEERKFSHEVEIKLLETVNRIKLQLDSQDGEITFKEMAVTPIPAGLESIVQKIEEKGNSSGWVYLD